MEIFLPPGGVWHKVIILVEKHHWLFSYTEEYYLLFEKAQQVRYEAIYSFSLLILPCLKSHLLLCELLQEFRGT